MGADRLMYKLRTIANRIVAMTDDRKIAMKIHQRTLIVEQADRELRDAMADVCRRHQLTFAEQFLIISSSLSNVARFALRVDRHPGDSGRPADVE